MNGRAENRNMQHESSNANLRTLIKAEEVLRNQIKALQSILPRLSPECSAEIREIASQKFIMYERIKEDLDNGFVMHHLDDEEEAERVLAEWNREGFL